MGRTKLWQQRQWHATKKKVARKQNKGVGDQMRASWGNTDTLKCGQWMLFPANKLEVIIDVQFTSHFPYSSHKFERYLQYEPKVCLTVCENQTWKKKSCIYITHVYACTFQITLESAAMKCKKTQACCSRSSQFCFHLIVTNPGKLKQTSNQLKLILLRLHRLLHVYM